MSVESVPALVIFFVKPVLCENNDPWEWAITLSLINLGVIEFVGDSEDLTVVEHLIAPAKLIDICCVRKVRPFKLANFLPSTTS